MKDMIVGEFKEVAIERKDYPPEKVKQILGSETLHQPMYNRDMADLLAAALFVEAPEHHIFNMPCERSYTDDEMLAVLGRVCPDVPIHMDPIPDYIPRGPVLDGTRARLELGFSPRYTLEEGVREMVGQFRDRAV